MTHSLAPYRLRLTDYLANQDFQSQMLVRSNIRGLGRVKTFAGRGRNWAKWRPDRAPASSARLSAFLYGEVSLRERAYGKERGLTAPRYLSG
jgi:hypothetical protein